MALTFLQLINNYLFTHKYVSYNNMYMYIMINIIVNSRMYRDKYICRFIYLYIYSLGIVCFQMIQTEAEQTGPRRTENE